MLCAQLTTPVLRQPEMPHLEAYQSLTGFSKRCGPKQRAAMEATVMQLRMLWSLYGLGNAPTGTLVSHRRDAEGHGLVASWQCRGTVGLKLKGLFQPKQFSDSITGRTFPGPSQLWRGQPVTCTSFSSASVTRSGENPTCDIHHRELPIVILVFPGQLQEIKNSKKPLCFQPHYTPTQHKEHGPLQTQQPSAAAGSL